MLTDLKICLEVIGTTSIFLQKYTKYIYPIADTYAYCLMPNHLHFMVKIKNEGAVLDFLKAKHSDLRAFDKPGDLYLEISRQFSHLFNGYTQGLNKMYNRKGSLFMPNFKRKQVEDIDYFTNLFFYIHNNPVHHGFTRTMVDWPYSSFHSYIADRELFVNIKPVLKLLGGIAGFEKLHTRKNVSKTFVEKLEEFLL